MQAKETQLQELIEGTKQYIVPLFQREYTWNPKNLIFFRTNSQVILEKIKLKINCIFV